MTEVGTYSAKGVTADGGFLEMVIAKENKVNEYLFTVISSFSRAELMENMNKVLNKWEPMKINEHKNVKLMSFTANWDAGNIFYFSQFWGM